MKKALIFCRKADSYSVERFIEECNKLSIETQILEYKRLSFYIDNAKSALLYEGNPVDLSDSIAYLRNPVITGKSADMDFRNHRILVEILLNHKVKVINGLSVKNFETLNDKLLQSQLYFANGIETIPTLYFRNTEDLQLYIKKNNTELLFKPRNGTEGKGIGLISNLKDVDIFINGDRILEKYIFQPFIPNNYDLRIIATRNEILGVIKRSRSSGLVNNFSAGGRVEKFDNLTDNMKETVMKVLEIFDLDYAGIDLIVDSRNNSFRVMEINRFCQFQGFEKVTGINVAKKLIELIINL